MASIWWVALAFFAGGLAGAILVALININQRDDELYSQATEGGEETPAPAVG